MVQIVALLSLYGLGSCFALLGSISVKLMPRLGIDKGQFGTLISVFMFSCLLVSLILGVTIDTVGFKPVAIAGFVLTAGVIFILMKAKTYTSTVIACMLLGLGAMSLNTAGNTLAPQVLYGGENPAAGSNLGNVFFGLGLFLTPLIVSFLFRKTSYEKTIGTLGVIILVPAVFAVFAVYPESPEIIAFGDIVQLVREPTVIVAALLLFCYVGLDISFSNWLPPFGKEVISSEKSEIDDDIADASAQRLLSLYGVAMMFARLAFSFVPNITTGGGYYIAAAAAAMLLVIVAMGVCRRKKTADVLAVAAGIASAPCFPTAVGVTFSRFSPSVHGTIFGIIFATGLLGAVIIPKTLGNMATGSSLQKSLKLLLVPTACLLVLALVLANIANPDAEQSSKQNETSPIMEYSQ